jgi:hypothetical protein
MADTGNQPNWRKSSRCHGGECIEIAAEGQSVLLRRSAADTPPTGILRVSAAEWNTFEHAIRQGEFDDLFDDAP